MVNAFCPSCHQQSKCYEIARQPNKYSGMQIHSNHAFYVLLCPNCRTEFAAPKDTVAAHITVKGVKSSEVALEVALLWKRVNSFHLR